MTQTLKTAAAAAALALAAACASTSFRSTWRNPDAQPVSLAGKKVAAFFIAKNEAARRSAETALARELTARGAQGIPGFTLVPQELTRDEARVRALMEQNGVDGMVMMRVAGRDKQVTVTPGYWTTTPYYRRGWGGYWGHGWAAVYHPGSMHTDTVVSVETLVFSTRQDLMLWAGMSDTMNPSRADAFAAELAKAVTAEMKKEGLLVP
jgi:hypothetical protein